LKSEEVKLLFSSRRRYTFSSRIR